MAVLAGVPEQVQLRVAREDAAVVRHGDSAVARALADEAASQCHPPLPREPREVGSREERGDPLPVRRGILPDGVQFHDGDAHDAEYRCVHASRVG